MTLFHIIEPPAWQAAMQQGEYRPASLDTEGFVHFSFAGQVADTANARFRNAAELCVIEIDPAAITPEIRVEDSYASGIEFPHVYGPVSTDAAVATHRLERDTAGNWTFNPGGRSGSASQGH